MSHRCGKLNDTQPVTGISSINKEQTDILSALTIKKPTLNTQLNYLRQAGGLLWDASKALATRDPPKGGYDPNFI